jgi:hypothetical protein
LAIITPLKARPPDVIVCAADPLNVIVENVFATKVPLVYVQFPPTVTAEVPNDTVAPLIVTPPVIV